MEFFFTQAIVGHDVSDFGPEEIQTILWKAVWFVDYVTKFQNQFMNEWILKKRKLKKNQNFFIFLFIFFILENLPKFFSQKIFWQTKTKQKKSFYTIFRLKFVIPSWLAGVNIIIIITGTTTTTTIKKNYS